jgi:hypothetical protein
MALKLDNNLLEELGLGQLPDAEKQLLLRQIYEKLEMNVGMRLADQMSNEQLDAFEKFVDANDDKGAFQWLENNFPNYKLVVNEEFEKLKAEIRSVAPQILATAGQQQAGAVSPGQAQAGPAAASTQGAQPQQSAASQPPQPQYVRPQAQQPQPQHQQYQQPQQASQQYQQQPPQQQPSPPQPAYQQPQPPQYPPAPAAGAVSQNGHLQPQYGAAQAPATPSQPQYGAPAGTNPSQQYQQPQQPPQYPPQPPAGPTQQ